MDDAPSEEVVEEVVEVLPVEAIDGTVVPIRADSGCVHGDSPAAVALAEAVRARLTADGVAIRPFAAFAA